MRENSLGERRGKKEKKKLLRVFSHVELININLYQQGGREVEVEVCGKMCVLCVVGGDYRLSSKTTFRFPEKLNFFLSSCSVSHRLLSNVSENMGRLRK